MSVEPKGNGFDFFTALTWVIHVRTGKIYRQKRDGIHPHITKQGHIRIRVPDRKVALSPISAVSEYGENGENVVSDLKPEALLFIHQASNKSCPKGADERYIRRLKITRRKLIQLCDLGDERHDTRWSLLR